jgi:hypothetical protein
MLYNYLTNININKKGRDLIKWARKHNHIEIQDWWIEHLDEILAEQ